jgi:hypothetical protein
MLRFIAAFMATFYLWMLATGVTPELIIAHVQAVRGAD